VGLRRGGATEAAITAPQVTEPYPVEHCSLCDFRAVCAARWEAEDRLVQVASVRRDQVTRLRDAGLPTLAALATSLSAADDMQRLNCPAKTTEAVADAPNKTSSSSIGKLLTAFSAAW
jgi:predicted RecB family nuclease